MESTKQIDEQISQLRTKAKELAARRAKLEGTSRLLEHTRAGLRSKSLRDNDEKAAAALQAGHSEAFTLNCSIEDLTAEITAIETDVRELLQQRDEAARLETIVALKVEMTSAKATARQQEKLLHDFLANVQPHLAHLKKIRAMALAAGVSEGMANKFAGDTMRRRIVGAFHETDGSAHSFAAYEKTPYDKLLSDIFDNVLRQIEPRAPSDEEKQVVNQ